MAGRYAETHPTAAPDFFLQNEGSIFLLIPQTAGAQQWIDENLPDGTLTFGNGYVVEHGYIMPIVDGIRGDGYTVAGR